MSKLPPDPASALLRAHLTGLAAGVSLIVALALIAALIGRNIAG